MSTVRDADEAEGDEGADAAGEAEDVEGVFLVEDGSVRFVPVRVGIAGAEHEQVGGVEIASSGPAVGDPRGDPEGAGEGRHGDDAGGAGARPDPGQAPAAVDRMPARLRGGHLAPDLAGHGKSGNNRENWTMSAFGQDIASVVEAAKLENVILVGFSLGGPAILEAAKLMPEQLTGN